MASAAGAELIQRQESGALASPMWMRGLKALSHLHSFPGPNAETQMGSGAVGTRIRVPIRDPRTFKVSI